MIKLSVITVTRNAETTLERTLRSVAEQSCPDIEHIIVDGASADRTVEILLQWKHEGMKWKSEPDNGLYDAMNKGAAMASGSYLCFLNAGDTFHAPDTVERLMTSYPSDAPPDILYGETAIVDDKGTFLHMRRLKAPEELNWKSFRQGMVVCHQAFFIRTPLFEPYNTDYRFSSDFDWCIRMMKKSRTLHNSHMVLINYLNEGMTTANRKASLKERYRVMTKYYGRFSTILHHLWFAIRGIFAKFQQE